LRWGQCVLTSSASAGNVWSNGDLTQTSTITASGSYTVYEVALGCTSAVSAPVVVTVNPIPATPTINPSGPTAFCAGGSVTLTSSSANGNTWNTGATSQAILVTTTGSFTVYVVELGCTSAVSTPTNVTVSPVPATPTITPSGSTTFCAGDNVILASSAAAGNVWSNGDLTPTSTITTSGTYTVYTVTAGCTSAVSLPVTVTVNPVPTTPTISPSGPTTFCAGGSVTLTSSGPLGNNWSTGATTPSINVTASGSYNVYVVELGCTSAVSAPVTVTVDPLPTSPIISPLGPTTFCQGDSVTLTSNVASGNLWNTGATTQSIVVTTGGSFNDAIVALGCTSAVSNAILVIVNPLPAPPTISQLGNVLTASPAASGYQWYFNGNIIPGATGQSYTATQTGDYTVVITDANGCTSAQSTTYIFTDVAAELQQALSVFPNPNNGAFRVQCTLPWMAETHISIVGLTGKEVYIGEFEAAGGILDAEIVLEGVADGMYFLRLEAGEQSAIIKLVKER
jgi:hypothetical protein